MSVIKIRAIEYGRLRSPDLDVQEKFLSDFGFVRSARTKTALYMRGTGSSHHLHVSELGPAGFIGFAYSVEDPESLERIARVPGATPIEEIDEPGGGRRVRLREPNGYQIEIVHGIEKLPELPVERYPQPESDPVVKPPKGSRFKFGPSRVRRVAHGVISTPDVPATVRWWREMLGVIPSDEFYHGSYDTLVGSFNRVDAGDEPVDHHVVYITRNQTAGLQHLSFEVEDVEDIFIGKEHLERVGAYEHMRGIGRHFFASQIYDYWLDPWGRMHEHWTSSERYTAASRANRIIFGEAFIAKYGEHAPERFIKHVTP